MAVVLSWVGFNVLTCLPEFMTAGSCSDRGEKMVHCDISLGKLVKALKRPPGFTWSMAWLEAYPARFSLLQPDRDTKAQSAYVFTY